MKESIFKTVRFKEVVQLKQGMAFNSKNNHLMVEEGIPLLRIVDLNNKSETRFVDSNLVSKRFISKSTDLIFSRTGVHLGLVYTNRVGVVHNNCFRIIPNKDVHYMYLYWFLKQKSIINHARGIAGGAAQPDLNHDAFKSIFFSYPNLPTQKKIASILSAYDELIENNNQRIQLLEEMASDIYKEWFVRFRFPNYQNTKFLDKNGKEVPHGTKDAIPEGWENGTIGSLYKVGSGFAFKGSELGDIGVPIIKIRNINNLEVDLINCDRFSGEINQRVNKFFLRSKDLLIAMTGATIGKVSLFPNTTEKYYLNQRVGKFFPHNASISTSYIYQFVKTRYFKETINNYGMGAAQPNISGEQIESIKIVIPEETILNKFSLLADSMIDEMLILRNKNQLLQETRDLLLPRLISGKLSVESLELEEMKINSSAEAVVK